MILLFSLPVFAAYEPAVTLYHPNYFIAGGRDDQAKFQISVKYNLIYPERIGLFAAYTQRAWWYIYDSSKPFHEFNHEPEFFYRLESGNNIFGLDMGVIDYIQLSPIFHRSNGKDGEYSRGMNLWYGEIQISGGNPIAFGLRAKGFGYYSKSSRNEDIDKYIGHYEGEVFVQVKSSMKYLNRERIYCRFGSGNDFEKGWMEAGLRVRILTDRIQPYVFAQVWHGYGEQMVDYDIKETRVRAGISYE